MKIHAELCCLCHTCESVCPADAIYHKLDDDFMTIDQDKCEKCGTCEIECPTGAIK